jgi:hypothetical protein
MNIKKIIFSLIFQGIALLGLMAQEAAPGYVFHRTDGTVLMAAIVQPNGDTMIYCELREIVVNAPRVFANTEDYKRYERYQRYAPTVISYALEAVRTYRQLEAATRDVSNRERKKYIEELEDKMDEKMRGQLKNLTRTQGFLLIKMIEKELHMPFYDLVKDVKGGTKAFYWNQFAKMFDYHLKDGYERGKDPILDSILDRYDLSYYLIR